MSYWIPQWKGKKDSLQRMAQSLYLRQKDIFEKADRDVDTMIDIVNKDPALQRRTPYAIKKKKEIRKVIQKKVADLKEHARRVKLARKGLMRGPKDLRADLFKKPEPGEIRAMPAPLIPLRDTTKILRGRPSPHSGRLTIPVHNDLRYYDPEPTPTPPDKPKEGEKPRYERRVNYGMSDEQKRLLEINFGRATDTEKPIGTIGESVGDVLDSVLPPQVVKVEPKLPPSRRYKVKIKRIRRQKEQGVADPKNPYVKVFNAGTEIIETPAIKVERTKEGVIEKVTIKDVITGAKIRINKESAWAMGLKMPIRSASGHISREGREQPENIRLFQIQRKLIMPQRSKRGAWFVTVKGGGKRYISKAELRQRQRHLQKKAIELGINPKHV